MSLFKVNSNLENALQKVEACMEENGIGIEYGCGGLLIRFKGYTYKLVDISQSVNYPGVQELPRKIEEERIEFNPIEKK